MFKPFFKAHLHEAILIVFFFLRMQAAAKLVSLSHSLNTNNNERDVLTEFDNQI